MKDELITLKNDINEYLKRKEIFKKQKMFFNMKVEEKQQELGEKKIVDKYYDPYYDAKFFEMHCPEAFEIVDSLRKKFPKYGQKRIKEMLVKELKIEYEDDFFYQLVEEVAEEYFIYESCGYKKVKKLEEELNELETKVNESAMTVLEQPKQALKTVGTTAKSIVRPYKEVAKGQLKGLKNTSKRVIHKNVKTLRKKLKKIEERTKEV